MEEKAAVKEERKIERNVGNLINEDRVLSFSDAVFAFAATLLVLKIDLPDLVKQQISTQFPQAFAALWPQYLANIISFLVIGYYWLNHHAIFGLVKKYNATLVWINLLFLIVLSFLPFPVDLYGDFHMTPVVVVFYSASLAVVGYMLCIVWWYASSGFRLVEKNIGRRQISYYTWRLLIAPLVFTLSIPLVYIDPAVAQFSWVFVLLGIVILNKTYHQKHLSKIEEASI